MRTVLGVLCICLVFNVVHGRSGGAPNSACDGVSPDASFHGAGAQTSTSPFTLTIQGNPTEYIPGQQYTLTFSNGGNNFRGHLVVSHNMNGNRVGSFTAGTNQRTTCSDSKGITHTNGNVDKTSVTLTWTAPAAGTGPITFRYSGVVVRTMYWANQMGPMLNEGTVVATTTVEASSTSTSTASSFAVSSSEVGTSTPSPSPATTSSTTTTSATGEATSAAMTMVMATPMPTSTASTEGTTSHGSSTVAGILMTMGILVIGLLAMIM